jgi:hypothetical protein
MELKINIELTHLEAFDIAQYFVNTLEMLQKIEVKNGGLHYHEARIRKTFQKVTGEIFDQITKEQENEIIKILDQQEREYNQTKNN